jgi:pterin-4a-carbinolamine dehydratase
MKSTVKALSKKDIKKLVKNFPLWKMDSKGAKCTRIFLFEKHIDALIFIARTTVNAEILKHYPQITFTHSKVKVVITTPDIKALTKHDIALLKRVEMVYTSQRGDNEEE